MSTPTEELRTAAARLRNNTNCDGHLVDCNSRELLEMLRILLAAREPLLRWLEDAATLHLPVSECGYCDGRRNPLKLPCPALAAARAINGVTEPGPGQDGRIEDKLSGSFLYEQLKRIAGDGS
ncbi:hypothetical protein OG352_05465 [Streptomyces sp. NBC_01485]|uniref:hypothetical protein n=1 Tax=Streptomyces sp. NBC_01485 TaxID=2903884 RepID=UPI002E35EC54|nr:hypothetical protein [Streptomyces sp. NBC_01485]